MNELDELLDRSAARPFAVNAELDRVVNRVVVRRRSTRALAVAGVVVLLLGGGTAAMAGTGTLDDIVDYYLSGSEPEHNDHAWEMDITGVDGTFHCVGGIVVMPLHNRPEYVEASYLAIKQFVQDHDWSDLQPDPSLLRPGQDGTAEQLAITADRHMIVVAQEAGYTLESITTRGTAQCQLK